MRTILSIFVSVLFTCSALEMEIGGAKQTFCDEYDTYIPSNPTTVKEKHSNNSKAKKSELKKRETRDRSLYLVISNKIEIDVSKTLFNNPRLSYTRLLQKSELRI